MRYYREVAADLNRERNVGTVLYLVANYDLLQFIFGFFRSGPHCVFLGLVKDWHAQLLDMPVLSPSKSTMRLGDSFNLTAPQRSSNCLTA